MDVLAFISFFLGASWDFFTEIKVPGFEFTFANLFVGVFLANLGLRFLMSMLGMNISAQDPIRAADSVDRASKPKVGRIGFRP